MDERHWDAGSLGCGHLAMQLRRQVEALPPGARLHVTASDPGAAVDLPAWCRLSGHRLVLADPPVYVLERRPDAPDPD